MRIALGVSYRGLMYQGWQSQPSGNTVQDKLESALGEFAGERLRTLCAGRTDAGVHALNQVVHFDTEVQREPASWVRGTNRYLPRDIAVQWCRVVGPQFHCRASARGRRYTYLLLESPVRPALESGQVGWSFRPLDACAMRAAAQHLIGEHDFSVFRSAQCQAKSPIKTLDLAAVRREGDEVLVDFASRSFLHRQVRSMVGSLVEVGVGRWTKADLAAALAAKDRTACGPVAPADGLYLTGVSYAENLSK